MKKAKHVHMNYMAIPGLVGKKDFAVKLKAESNEDKAERILSAVLNYFSLSKDEIKSKDRRRIITYPRHLCIFLIQRNTTMRLEDIAKIFGGRDHSTAIHSIKTVNDLQETDERVVADLENIKMTIKRLQP